MVEAGIDEYDDGDSNKDDEMDDDNERKWWF